MRSILFAFMVVTGCSSTTHTVISQPSAPAPAPEPLATTVTLADRDGLREQIRQLLAELPPLGAATLRVTQEPRLRRSRELERLANALAQKQVELALVVERTDRYLAAADPRVADYERQIGTQLAELREQVRLLDEAVHQGGRRRAMQRLRLAAADLSSRIDHMSVLYDALDRRWVAAIAPLPPTVFTTVDVRHELTVVPRTELTFVLCHYVVATPADASVYAVAYHIPPPTLVEWNEYQTTNVYVDNSVTVVDNSVTVVDNSVNITDNSVDVVDNSVTNVDESSTNVDDSSTQSDDSDDN